MRRYCPCFVLVMVLFSFFLIVSTAFGSNKAGAHKIKAELIAVSKLPDPKSTPYEDCLIVHKMANLSKAENDAMPDVFYAIFFGFLNRKLEPASKYQVGDRFEMELIPEEAMGPDAVGLQRFDFFNEFSGYYFVTQAVSISSQNRQKKPKSILESKSNERLKSTEQVKAKGPFSDSGLSLEKQIAKDRDRIKKLLNAYGSYEEWYNRLSPQRQEIVWNLSRWDILHSPDKQHHFEGINWIAYELDDRRLPKKAVSALVRARKYLKKRNIDLMLVPIPPKELFTAQFFVGGRFPRDGVMQPYRLKLFDHLMAQGIEVVDLLPYMLAYHQKYSNFYYPNSDQHPADGLIRLAADIISRRVERYNLKKTLKNDRLVLWEEKGKVPERFLNRSYKVRYSRDDLIKGTKVIESNGKVIEPAKKSTIFIVGDSFLTSTQKRGITGADVWAHIAYNTGVLPQIVSRAGTSGAPKLNPIIKRNKALKESKVCIVFFDEKYLFFSDPDWIDK